MRDDDQRAAIVLQRFGERLAHLDVEMVGRLVEQQQIGFLADDERQRQSRLLAAGKIADGGGRHVAAKIEAAQEIAKLLLARVRFELAQMPQRRMLVAQLLDLVLREIAEAQSLRDVRDPRYAAPACRRSS